MALDKKVAERLLNRLDTLQKEIESIHQELLFEINNDTLSAAEIKEIESIREENNYRTLKEWAKEGLGFHLDIDKD